ncbi:MAG: DUF2027 domain-containing protein [Bacteroidales bacterium]|nr:DUF2027 domain-containing protein [Bacteroidales bacterium]
MQIRIGDEVSFLSEKLDGKVTSIIDANTVNVYCDVYGFEIPASVNDLVVTKSTLGEATTITQSDAQNSTINTAPTNTVFIALVPDDYNNLQTSRFDLYIVNDTAQTALYSVATLYNDTYNGLSAGNIDPNSILQLGTYNLKDIETKLKTIIVQYLLYTKRSQTWAKPAEATIKLSPTSICKSGAYKQSKFFKNVALIKECSEKTEVVFNQQDELQPTTANIKIVPDKKVIKELNFKLHNDQKVKTAIKEQKEVNPNIVEIDLHAEALLETTAGMDSGAILEFQMEVFIKTMEKYKLRKGQKIVFIHGKGEGILRQRIMWLLQTTYKRHNHQDASFKQYGFGATMVTIR